MSSVLRSGILALATSSSCSRVAFPTFSVFGVGLPLSSPSAFRSSTDAGGVLVMNVKLRSA